MSKKIERFEDIEIYDPAVSATGNNAYYIDTCAIVGQRPSYASCLTKIAARKEGRLPTALADCSAAIGKCECPAQAMRKKEIDAGQAMFFINRRKLNEFVAEQEGITHQAILAMPNKQVPTPAPKKKPITTVTTGGYEDAINAAMKKLSAPTPAVKPAAPPAPIAQPTAPAAPAKAGMSLIELARLQLAAKAQLTA